MTLLEQKEREICQLIFLSKEAQYSFFKDHYLKAMRELISQVLSGDSSLDMRLVLDHAAALKKLAILEATYLRERSSRKK